MNEELRQWNMQLFAEEDPEPEEPDEAEVEVEEEEKEPDKISLTQAELDEMIKKAKAKDRQAFRNRLEKEFKAEQAEAEKKAKMSAEDKVKYELEQYQKRVQELEAAQTKALLSKEATRLLKDKDIDANDDILEFLVGTDEEDTGKRVDAFVAIVEGAVERREKSRATGRTPKSTDTKHEEVSELQKRINKYKN